MTPQEAQMLQDLVNKVEGTQLNEKDPDAEALLNDGLSRDPDALYKMAQTVLIQNLALNQARFQIDQLRRQPVVQQPAKSTSFLGSLLGHHDPAPPPPPQYQAPQYAPPQYQTVPQYQGAPQQVAYGQPPSGAGSFLRSAATTAAGVAAGALAFEGIESLMHGGHGGGFFGGGGSEYGGGYGMGGGPMEETVVNNYYGDQGQPGGNYSGDYGQDMQPQGPYDAGSGPDMQPQGPYDNAGDSEQASYDDQGMDADMGSDDSGGGFSGDDQG